jgi:hypothetical protein
MLRAKVIGNNFMLDRFVLIVELEFFDRGAGKRFLFQLSSANFSDPSCHCAVSRGSWTSTDYDIRIIHVLMPGTWMLRVTNEWGPLKSLLEATNEAYRSRVVKRAFLVVGALPTDKVNKSMSWSFRLLATYGSKYVRTMNGAFVVCGVFRILFPELQ